MPTKTEMLAKGWVLADDETPTTMESNTPAVIPTQEGMVPLGRMDGQNNEVDMVDNSEEEISFTPVKAKEFKFPTLKPGNTRAQGYMPQVKRLGMLVDTIENPEYAQKAREVLNSGARISDIDKTIKIFRYKEREEKENIKRKQTAQEIAVDKKKLKQKYAAQTGDFQASLDNLDYLIDNFDDDYVGYVDTKTHDWGRLINWSDPKQSQYKKRFSTILPNFKELENMGASFTKSEQKMLNNIMPQIDSGDILYRADLVNFIEILRNKISGKLNALEDGDYRTGVLRDIVGRYNKTLKRAKAKFGKDYSENNEVDKNGNMIYPENEEDTGTKVSDAGFISMTPQKEQAQENTIDTMDIDYFKRKYGR